MTTRPTYTLTIRAEPGHVPIPSRLKRLLKSLLRSFGFRCVALIENREPDEKEPNE